MLLTSKYFFYQMRVWIYQLLEKSETIATVQYHFGILNGMINMALDADIISLNTWLLLYSLICKIQNEKIKEIS